MVLADWIFLSQLSEALLFSWNLSSRGLVNPQWASGSLLHLFSGSSSLSGIKFAGEVCWEQIPGPDSQRFWSNRSGIAVRSLSFDKCPWWLCYRWFSKCHLRRADLWSVPLPYFLSFPVPVFWCFPERKELLKVWISFNLSWQSTSSWEVSPKGTLFLKFFSYLLKFFIFFPNSKGTLFIPLLKIIMFIK